MGRFRPALVALAVSLLAAVPAAAVDRAADPTRDAAQEIAQVERPTPIASYAGTAVFSVFDLDAGVYRLALSRQGGPPEILPVAPRQLPFDADIGPGRRGGSVIVYSRCKGADGPGGADRRDCDLYIFNPASQRERRIRNSDSNVASEVEPTIWRGRIAFVRILDERAGEVPIVYTRRLASPRTERSLRLPGVPRRACSLNAETCGETNGRRVHELELFGRRLALVVRYRPFTGGGTCGLKEVRLGRIDSRRQLLLAQQVCRFGRDSYAGAAFSGGNLYWARFCDVQTPRGACGADRGYGAYRYDLSAGSFGFAGYERRLSGFSWAGDGRAYEVRLNPGEENGTTCENEKAVSGAPPCRVVITEPLSFRPVPPPR